MIRSSDAASIRPGNHAHERGTPPLCPQPAERPQILSLGTTATLVVTSEAAMLSLPGTPADSIRTAENP